MEVQHELQTTETKREGHLHHPLNSHYNWKTLVWLIVVFAKITFPILTYGI